MRTQTHLTGNSESLQLVHERGPWPFITHRVYENWDGAKRFWSSRHHRKQLVLEEDGRPIIRHRVLLRSLWMPSLMNWWIGVIFAIGAASFAVASLLYLLPSVAKALSLSTITKTKDSRLRARQRLDYLWSVSIICTTSSSSSLAKRWKLSYWILHSLWTALTMTKILMISAVT